MPGSIKCAEYRQICVIKGFRREIDEIFVLLGYYTASSVNSLQTIRTDRLSRNVGKELPLLAA
jgi:hypothetical protein